MRPAWVRPIRKKTFSSTSQPGQRNSQSPAASSDSGNNGRGFSPPLDATPSAGTFAGSEFFTDPSFGMQMDPVPPETGMNGGLGGFMNPADVMSFLNDPMVDLGSMFPSGAFDPSAGGGQADGMFGGPDIGRKLSVTSP
jgi:hypothetical protein